MKNFYLILNIIGIISTIIICIFFTKLLGYPYLIILGLITIIWNITYTIYKSIKINGLYSYKIIIRSLFSTNIFLPFIVYGCYCSPQYGLDGKTRILKPIDDLDKACLEHDSIMLKTIEDFNKKLITKEEYKQIRNKADFNFIKSVLFNLNNTTYIYIIFLILGFLIRIILRSLFK